MEFLKRNLLVQLQELIPAEAHELQRGLIESVESFESDYIFTYARFPSSQSF